MKFAMQSSPLLNSKRFNRSIANLGIEKTQTNFELLPPKIYLSDICHFLSVGQELKIVVFGKVHKGHDKLLKKEINSPS